MKLIIHAQGYDGVVDLMDDRLIIHRPGFRNWMRYGRKRNREIPLHAISNIDFREATTFAFGEFNVAYAGMSFYNPHENLVRFNIRQQPMFAQLKDKVFALIQGRK